MTIKTPLDIINTALIRSGVLGDGTTASASQVNRAFDQLNGIISLWNRKRWLKWAEIDVGVVSTGAVSYTIGDGGDFDTPRPERLQAAYVRLWPIVNNQPYDRPLYIIESHEDYSRISLKQLVAYPSAIFYDTQFPLGILKPWTVPTVNQFELHVIISKQIEPFTTLTESLLNEVPPEYLEALIWNLAKYLRPAFQLPADPQIEGLANNTLQTIRKANIQIPTMVSPDYYGNGGRASGLYSWLTGGMG